MATHEIALIVATLLCSLTAGLVFAFASVVMPGIRNLDDRDFIRAFQVMDRIIQNNQPAFMVVWVGSMLALIVAVVSGIGVLVGTERLLLALAAVIYLLGVQLPTVAINIPLNNELQALNVDVISEASTEAARKAFEPRWNRWNSLRTGFAASSAALLMVLLLRL